MFPLFFIGMGLLAGFIPPPSPADSAQEIAARFAENRSGIRVGLVLTMFASGLLCLYFAAISAQIRQIERGWSALSVAQAIAAACTVLEFIFPLFAWQAAAFRADRSPEMVQMLVDLGWLPFMGITSTFLVQLAIIAWVTLGDDRQEPVWPRWVAYLNAWVFVGIVPGTFCVFFQTGPLAWDGIFAWWVVVISYFVWMCAMTYVMVKAVQRDDAVELETVAAG